MAAADCQMRPISDKATAVEAQKRNSLGAVAQSRAKICTESKKEELRSTALADVTQSRCLGCVAAVFYLLI